jgi:hypothetical protein
MKTSRVALILLAIAAIAIPAVSQDRGRPSSGSESSGSATSPGTSSISTRGVAVGNTSSSGVVMSAPRGFSSDGSFSSSSRSYGGGGGGGGGSYYVPDFRGTSFYYNPGMYYSWQQYMYQLQMLYYLSPTYFTRFYRNNEPLLTPQLMKLSLRAPVILSTRMLAAVEELEMMLAEAETGKAIDKAAISDKTKEIRELAAKIRKDEVLAFVDRGAEKDVMKGLEFDNPGLEGVHRLREMVVDLNNQLKGMYSETTTSTVSVDSLTQPSFGSLTKGIEKMAKAVENSSKRY